MECVISCEHASNRVPQRFAQVFDNREEVLFSHEAYDPGAGRLAGRLAKQLGAPLYQGSITRLLIDLNRSKTNRKSLFSEYSRKLNRREREVLLQRYHQPYREKVEYAVGKIIAAGKPALHISIHSFAPVKKGIKRKADIGLLYDPTRKCEKELCADLVGFIKQTGDQLIIRRNYPYQGKTDGLTSFLRNRYAANQYAGIEIEMNQSLLRKIDCRNSRIVNLLAEGISKILRPDPFSQPVLSENTL